MNMRGSILLLVILSLLDLSYTKPEQKILWIIQKQSRDDGTAMDISVDNLPMNNDFDNFLKTSSVNVNKALATRCYRDDVPTIDVNLYYEGLCGGCMNFVANELYPAYEKLGKYINLQLLPYGNTRTSDTPDSEGNNKQ